jgi:hypothetical protein
MAAGPESDPSDPTDPTDRDVPKEDAAPSMYEQTQTRSFTILRCLPTAVGAVAALAAMAWAAQAAGWPASQAEKAAATAAKVPGGDPAATAAAYAARLKGMPKFDQPLLFHTPQADAVLKHVQVFPADNPFNEDISTRPVAANSEAMIATMQPTRGLGHNSDMGYVLVPPGQTLVDVRLTAYVSESDAGPYPMPDNAPIEDWNPAGGESLADKQGKAERGDRHVIVVDPAAGLLFEFYQGRKTAQGWQASNEATFDLKTNALRPAGWTSSDAAGLPVFPLTVRYDDLAAGEVKHAVRVTVRRSRSAYVYPATHKASNKSDPSLPRMGERLRLKAGVDISGLSPHAQAVCKGMKKYGLIVADNGANWLISVAPDPRIKGLDDLRKIKGGDFEVIVPTGPNEGPRAQR